MLIAATFISLNDQINLITDTKNLLSTMSFLFNNYSLVKVIYQNLQIMQLATTINTEYTDLNLVWKFSAFIEEAVHQIFQWK